MDLWLKITNTVTAGNIGGFVFLLSAIVLGYYKIRRLIAAQHVAYLAYVATLTEAQTKRIEDCIHKLPAHPENTTNNQPGGTQITGNLGNVATGETGNSVNLTPPV